jgi:hypothetical protein
VKGQGVDTAAEQYEIARDVPQHGAKVFGDQQGPTVAVHLIGTGNIGGYREDVR